MSFIAAMWGRGARGALGKILEGQRHRREEPDDTQVLEVRGVDGGAHEPDCSLSAEWLKYAPTEERSVAVSGELWPHASPPVVEAPATQVFERADELLPRAGASFACALAEPGELVVARDPLGIEPLYCGLSTEAIYLASEIKALTQVTKDIWEFPPAAVFHTERGARSYYDLDAYTGQRRDIDVLLDEVRATVEEAVVRRLVSARTVGVLLSGGVTSSIVAAIAASHAAPLHTFTIGLPWSADLEAARSIAASLGTHHHEYIIDADEVMANLPSAIFHLESYAEEIVPDGLTTYLAAARAAEHVDTLLTGDGAEVLFAGRSRYRRALRPQQVHDRIKKDLLCYHRTGLQRSDRSLMAWAIRPRMPFLDLDVVELALSVHPELKIRSVEHAQVADKWLLRLACADLLPDEILWRRHHGPATGSGVRSCLRDQRGAWLDRSDAELYRRAHTGGRLRSLDECLYHLIARDVFDNPEPILRLARGANPSSESRGRVM